MELDRPHRPPAPSTPTTSDLFICFSSMRVSSKSMISPGRTDKPPISLTASLSRRLRSKNGSLKGGQSPMFPPQGVVVSKKRGGCAIENNPEPSSPKVTCIGQVRVKTKKHGKKMKMNMSRAYRGRRSGRGEQGIQRVEGEGCLQHRNQRWVHLPMTICDALKGFGSEFNSCFSPCRPSSCFTSSEVKGNRQQQQQQQKREDSSSSSCGGSVCRWLVALHEGEVGRGRDIELVVGEEEEEKERVVVMERECSRRRSVFDDMDFNIDEICEVGNEIEEEEEDARLSICIPPKNALLLMRCRSDPVKMSALSSKFCWDQIGDGVADEGMRRRSSVSEYEKIESLVTKTIKVEPLSSFAKEEEDQKKPVEEKEQSPQSTEQQLEVVDSEEQQQQSAGPEMYEELIQEEKRFSVDFKDMDHAIEDPDGNEEEVIEVVAPSSQSPDPLELKEDEEDKEEIPFEIDQQTVVGKVSIFEQHEEDIQIQTPPLQEDQEESPEEEEEEEKNQINSKEQLIEEPREDDDTMEEAGEDQEGAALPDCLLLMMCEPKLSMEVSKETWVCSTDFIRWLPERHRQHHLKKINPTNTENDSTNTTTTTTKNKTKKKNTANTTTKSNPPPAAAQLIPAAQLPPQPQGLQPPRSSCSFPIAGGAKEKKRVSYEPLALTRCKSAPMRSATAKLAPAPELACSWKNRKIEPHRPATCGVGAAGIGC